MAETFETDIEQCLQVLQKGGIILYPTDTIWGLGCDATNAAAVEKIIHLKLRPENKSFVVLVSSEKEVLQHAASIDLRLFDLLNQADRPTTVIYDHGIGLAENVLAEDGSVAIRICRDEFCKHLIKRFKKPIVSTSANTSGMPFPASFQDIEKTISAGVDYVVNHKQDDRTAAKPSALIRWKDGKIDILR